GTSVSVLAQARPRRARTRVLVAAAVLALGTGVTLLFARGNGEKRWAEQTGLPELRRLSAPGPTVATDSGFLIAQRLHAPLPRNAEVDSLARIVTTRAALKTRTPGARVSWTAYRGDTSGWHLLGTTPLDSVPLAATRQLTTLLKIEQAGYRTAVRPLVDERR